MFKFQCKGCGKKYKVEDDWAGKKVKCKKCNQKMNIPEASRDYVENSSRALEKTNVGERKKSNQTVPSQDSANYQYNSNKQEESSQYKITEEKKSCQFCGEEILKVAKKCKHCGEFIGSEFNTASSTTTATGINTHISNSKKSELPWQEYAGFWKRVLASIIDVVPYLIIFGISYMIAYFVSGAIAGATSGSPEGWTEDVFIGISVLATILSYLFAYVFQWIYKAVMESSAKQGTFGKMVVGLKVVDLNGKRISFGRASLRWLVMMIIIIIPIVGIVALFMAGWTEKKQTLYDMICHVTVIKIP